MTFNIPKTVLAWLMVLALPTVALAQTKPDAIINNQGIGFSRMDDGAVIAYDLVEAYDNHTVALANCESFKSNVQGVSWCFASAANKETFDSATEDSGRNHYLPFVGGHCSLGMSLGNLTARGDPRTAVRIGNQLVLNGNLNVRTSFLQDTERNMDNARLRYQLANANGDLRKND